MDFSLRAAYLPHLIPNKVNLGTQSSKLIDPKLRLATTGCG
jgi:hypothetical protein